MQIIAVVNEKGGTGKTTTAVNLSAALGELGRKVLLVDLDGQAASSRWLGVEEDTSFADALWHGEKPQPLPDVIPGVSLLPGSGKLDSVAHDLRPTQGGQLRKLLSQVSGFDYAVIDCPPSLGNRLIGNALLAATHAIVPVETSILALDGLKILLTTVHDVRDGFGHDIVLAGVVACRYDARTRLSRLVLAELKRALPGKVFNTVIRENVRVRECPGSGQSILTYAPDSHAAEDYRSLAKEVVLGLSAGKDSHAPADEAHQALADMRKQVDVMLRKLGPIAEKEDLAEASGAGAPPAEEPPAEQTGKAESKAKPAPPAFVQPDEESPQAEPEESIINVPPDGAATDETKAAAGPDAGKDKDQIWDLDSAGSEPGGPAGPPAKDGADREASPLKTDTAWDEGTAARPQAAKDKAREIAPAKEKAPAAAREDEPSRKKDGPAETKQHAAAKDAPPEQKQVADGHKNYPALRGMLRKMSGGESNVPDDRRRAKPAQKGKKKSAWRRIFGKKASAK